MSSKLANILKIILEDIDFLDELEIKNIKLNDKDNEISKLKTDITNKDNDISKLNTDIKNKNNEIGKLKTDITNKDADISKLNTDIKDKNNEIGKLKTDITNKDNEIEKINEKLNEKASQLSKVASKLGGECSANTRLKTKCNVLDSEISKLQQEKDRLNSDVVRINNEKLEEVKALEIQIQSLEETISIQKVRINEEEKKLQVKQSDFEDVKSELNQTRRENYELKNQNEELNEHVSELRKQIELLNTSSEQISLKEEGKIEPTEEDKINLTEETVNDKDNEQNTNENTKTSSKISHSETTSIDNLEIKGNTNPSNSNILSQEQKVSKDAEKLPIKKVAEKSKQQQKIEEIKKMSEGAIKDFPSITNVSKHHVRRTIKFVHDKSGKIIDADNFFEESSAEEIARIARQLAEAGIKGETFWSCGACGGKIIIAARESIGGESLFFTHSDKDIDCPWYKKSTKSKDDEEVVDDYLDQEDIENNDIILNVPQKIKELMYALLRSETSKNHGIDDVQIDTIVRSRFPYAKWRRPDLSFTFSSKDSEKRKMVIQLQRKRQSVGDIADKDIFYRLNDTHVVWIFGCENDNTYEYIKRHAFKNTLFHNHRNVYVFDEEAQKESISRDELVLKCNWLDNDDNWAIRLEKDDANGRFVTLDDLIFDDEYCKPYYYDANSQYFEKYPEERKKYENSLETREELLKKLEENWTKDKSYEQAQRNMRSRGLLATPYGKGYNWGFRFNTIVLIQPIFTEEPRKLSNGYYVVRQNQNIGLLDKYAQKVIDWDGTFLHDIIDYDEHNEICIVCVGEKHYVTDKKGNFLIDAPYESILFWSTDIFKVKLNGKWGLCNIKGQIITDCWYYHIGNLVGGKAEATFVPDGDWRQYNGHIDGNGKQIASEIIPLVSGKKLIKKFGRWGVIDSQNNVLLPCEYDAIGSWHETLYRVKKERKWGVIDVETKSFILPIEYDLIDNVVEEVALVERNGIKSYVGVDGVVRAEKIINLQDGLRKVLLSGKWGIFDSEENEIIAPQYDEIGTFRGRFIGIINGHIIKLNAYYKRPVYLSAKYVKKEEKKKGKFRYIFEIAGVKLILYMADLNNIRKDISQICDDNGYCHHIAFVNLIFNKKIYTIKYLEEQNLTRLLSHGDKESDFNHGETYIGIISNFKKRNGKIMKVKVSFPDGKVTMVRKHFFMESGKNIEDYPVHSEIKLRKDGYDDELDQTIWIVES